MSRRMKGKETSPIPKIIISPFQFKMKWYQKINTDVLFIICAILYFSSRQPTGGLQLTADVLMIITLVLIVIKHVIFRWYK